MKTALLKSIALLTLVFSCGVATGTVLGGCKQAVSPAEIQTVLTIEQVVCAGFAAIAGASTPDEVKILCPALPALTQDVIAAINAIIGTANAQASTFPEKAIVQGMRGKLTMHRQGDSGPRGGGEGGTRDGGEGGAR